ncbi:30S ribosomal protein S9, mitochondrial [Syzygium oleosum]|uniref:30S ribosomal protein S9, mitochondrial n=1 Tax=Syzygium oleosum TaxID=219896 RepID=UPI0011D28ACE|nr:30S ribosomal protein S9, mitochondrial [Syzygium oleosum]
MLARLLTRPSNLPPLLSIAAAAAAARLRSNPPPPPSSRRPHLASLLLLRRFSTDRDGGNGGDSRDPPPSDPWKLSGDGDGDAKFDRLFSEDSGKLAGFSGGGEDSWLKEGEAGEKSVGEDDGWLTAEGYRAWSLVEEGKDDGLFDIGEGAQAFGDDVGRGADAVKSDKIEEEKRLEREEQELTTVLKGPNRAFGDLIAASGITDAMLDSLIALKDFEGIEGLPPLREIEDMRYEKNTRKSTRAEIERLKQEEVAKARVRQVDDKERAYGTGRRKCSIARVWVQPGDGKFTVNEKEVDVYFPMLDHRAALLRPFSETKTLGLWDVNCTVKGGGVSGQVGAIRLGISRALQNWEPGLRPALRSAGFLTRDPRVVERKKPGKAKARKSFQWVKR